jgi:pilus assembly protein CpaB
MTFTGKNKFLIAILLAGLISLIVVVMSAIWLKKMDSVAMVQVVVATDQLQPGMKLSNQQMGLSNWPRDSIPVGAVKSAEQLVNRVPKMEIAKGEIILERMLVPLSSAGSMAVQIAPGKRAFTMSVNEAGGVAGFAMPGNFVDVILNSKDTSNQEASKIILQKILILAIAQDRLVDDSKPKVVNAITIEVSPQEAETLDLARSIGSLSLVLRHQNDDKNINSNGIGKRDLIIGQVRDMNNEKKAVKGNSVEVIRGVARESIN